MTADRLKELEDRQDEHATSIVRLEVRMEAHERRLSEHEIALRANTDALNRHASSLSEYAGAHRIIHWVVTAALAVAGWFVGKGHSG